MKILLVTHYYPGHRGGIEIVAGKLAEYLGQKKDVEIRWFASDANTPPQNNPNLFCSPVRCFNFIENKFGLPCPLWSPAGFVRLWRAVKTADLIHLHDYLYFGNLAAFAFAKVCHKPVAITQHIGFISYQNPFLRCFLAFLNKSFGRWILKSADQVIFISEVVQKYFSQNSRFRRPPVMIANGVDTAIFFPIPLSQRAGLKKRLGLRDDQPVLLFVGRFIEKKGLKLLRTLASRLDSIQWLFAGWGPMDPARWGLKNIHVYRDYKGPQIAQLYQVSDLLVLPSYGEGFPLVVQEAMACGTPVLVTEDIADGYSLGRHLMFREKMIGEQGIERWSSRIKQITANKSKLLHLRTEVAAFALQHWPWAKSAESYHRLFQTLRKKSCPS